VASKQRLMSIFDIMGPIMTGPSSSHTAGAVRIGKMARMLFGRQPVSIDLSFYGSLAETYHGHMTDAGVVAGIMEMAVDDLRIRQAQEIAANQGMRVRIHTDTESSRNPNTIEIEMLAGDDSLQVGGITVGGGEIVIDRVGEVTVELRGDRDTILVCLDQGASAISSPGRTPIENVRKALGGLVRSEEHYPGSDQELVSCELCSPVESSVLTAVSSIPGVQWCRFLPCLYDYSLRDSEPLFRTFSDLLEHMKVENRDFPGIVVDYESRRSGLSEGKIRDRMLLRWQVMRDSVAMGLRKKLKLIGGITSGEDAKRLFTAYEAGKLVSGRVLALAEARAVAVGELNAAMGRVVAAPTAGAAGVIPAVVMTLAEELGSSEDQIVDALLVASMIGLLIANRAPVSGAIGGCQSEVGVASAMAAGAAVQLKRGDPDMVLNAMSFALKNILGLVCDPVAGPVEVPCIKRNVIGVANAFSAADLALAGIRTVIPPDEVVDALRNVQELLPMELRDTTLGGLGCTKTGLRLKQEWLAGMQSG
jgi:L-serine dehydratase